MCTITLELNWYPDGWIVKWTPKETLFGLSRLAAHSKIMPDIIEVSGGGYIVVLTTYSDDNDVPRNAGRSDYWVVKLDVDGNIIWSKTFGRV